MTMNTTTDKIDKADVRVLVIEDEAAIAMLIEDMLLDMGFENITIFGKLSRALDAVKNAEFDFAVLDVNLAGEPSYPLAAVLQEKKTPFAFSTGYGAVGVREDFRNYPVLQKPFTQKDLADKLSKLVPQYF
ncbi:MAG: response regulator [Methylobacteriaceae bacterium]|nr:response regulator [Methylobacteriaceae bacterium]